LLIIIVTEERMQVKGVGALQRRRVGRDQAIEEFLTKCDRCGSAMIREKFYGLQEHFFGWKCIYCGEIVDHLILENRRSPTRIGKERQEAEKMNT
jgi:hypothetical protein